MSVYVFVAFAAVFVKGYLWIISKQYTWAGPRWYLLVAAFLFQNIVELVGYFQLQLGIAPVYLLKTYYVTLIVLSLSILVFVSENLPKRQPFSEMLFVLLGSSLTVATLFGNGIVSGYEPNSYPVKAIKGEWFSVYLVYGLLIISSTVFLILKNLVEASDSKTRREHFYELAAFSPFFIITFSLALALLLGLPVNGSALFPIASTLFMVITVILRCTPLYLIISSIATKHEYRLFKCAGLNALKGMQESGNLKQVINNQEAILLAYAIEKLGRNKSKLSEYLGVGRRTLDRKLKKHDLWWNG